MMLTPPAHHGASTPRFGLVLGSGSARGWAHIGVIRALEEAGLHPDIVCGASIGAFVGAAYADGKLDELEAWVRALDRRRVFSFFDVSFSGGLLKGEKLMSFFASHFEDKDFSVLPRPFACVATDLASGREIWLREGSVAQAVRASVAVPGLLAPQVLNGRLLVDGGVVNPVPVSLCRALGAEIVLAVDLGSDVVSQRHKLRQQPEEPSAWAERWRTWIGKVPEPPAAEKPTSPRASMLDVLATSINIMQIRIARSRLAGEPADVLVAPRVAQLGLLDYHRGDEAIDEGREAMRAMLPLLRRVVASM
jgi:NTE family protein